MPKFDKKEETETHCRRSNREPKLNLRYGYFQSVTSLTNSTNVILGKIEPTNSDEAALTAPTNSADDALTAPTINADAALAAPTNSAGAAIAIPPAIPLQYHYEVDLTEMAARNTVNAANFKNYLRDQFKKKANVSNLANNVTVKQEDWKVIVKSATFFKKSTMKYHAKKFLKSKKLRDFVKVVGNGNNDYRFTYYKP